ncbi:post-transcriptional regulator [Neobacillus sp. PS3-40]|uniref:post-transcriptional regulator n=1 Tax=Neobacillus sp. PS3-40 TaxID=3070679 RepID=UPI0027DF9668|nr:post-transcriptional regulator [Neobacillus sp. PS3-40]WML45515.1 post-transcriptional regulator [Neobacillus sp. PS3-40]
MKIDHEYEHFRIRVKPALRSKLDEFQMLGYNTISEKELWEYLIRKKWKKVKDDKKLFEIVQDILSIKVSDYMSFATIEAYKSPELLLKGENEWKMLLK